MSRSLAVVLLAAGLRLSGAIFPDQIGDFTRKAPQSFAVPDQGLYSEFGLEATETADFTAPPKKKFTATAWRFRDSTGAMAMFQARRPSGAAPRKLTDLSVTTSDGIIYAHGNYVFQITGNVPDAATLEPLYRTIPKLEQSPLPALMGYLPANGLVPNSERYILGPVSLDHFAPGIPPATAAFHLGAEGQSGKYRTQKGVLNLVIFNYPTPNLARDRFEDVQKVPGVIAKRAGPLVAVIAGSPDPDAAERLLSQVQYQANMTWNEKVPGHELKTFSNMILSMFALSGILIVLSIIAGVGFGGFRVLRKKLGGKDEPDAMITLRLK